MFYPVFSSSEFYCYPTFDFTRLFHRGIIPSLSPSTIYIYSFSPLDTCWESQLIHVASQLSTSFFSIKPIELPRNSLIALSYKPIFHRYHADLGPLTENFLLLKNPYYRAQLYISSSDEKRSSFYAGEFPLFPYPSSLVSFFPSLCIPNSQYICLLTPNAALHQRETLYVVSGNDVLDELDVYSNSMNIFPVKQSYGPYRLVCPRMSGVPLLIIQNTDSLSIEHTHPLCEYFPGRDSFKHMRMLKSNEIKTIVSS